MITRSPLISSLALLLAGCAGAPGSGTYPSLAKRPIESGLPSSPEPVPEAPSAVADPALGADIDRLSKQARDGDAAFGAAYGDAERLARAASRSSVSSDAWVSAQVAISGLESSRNDSMSALAALDVLYADRAGAEADGKVTGGGQDAIDMARRDALALVDAQNDRLDALKAMLPQP
ncbi:MAG: hypothetical protein DI547_10285 [Sphingobium sp.]|nr:MAG: hypothetical protein DI547_10285 [Sphingobium sp.]